MSLNDSSALTLTHSSSSSFAWLKITFMTSIRNCCSPFKINEGQTNVKLFLTPFFCLESLQKGGIPAAPSGTATLLRLSPSYLFYPRQILTVTDFRHHKLPWLDGRCVQGPGTYSPYHCWYTITSESNFTESSCRLRSELGSPLWICSLLPDGIPL